MILLLVCSNSFGQQTKFVLKDRGGFKEEYYVLKNEKKIRHGTYVKYRQPLGEYVIIESGNYSNGEKNGLWEIFYNSFARNTWNAIKEKGNYVNGKKNGIWTYYYLDTMTNLTNIETFGQKRKKDSINLSIDQRNAKLKLAGMYLNDKRVGEWTSLNYLGNLSQKYNFSTETLLYDESVIDSLQYNQNRRPLFVGGYSNLNDFLYRNLDIGDFINKIGKDSTYAIAQFTIDEQGKAADIVVTSNSDNKILKEEFSRVINLNDFNWIPGLKDGQKEKFALKLRVDIFRTGNTPNSNITLRFRLID